MPSASANAPETPSPAWSPNAWRSRPSEQQPTYPDAAEAARVLCDLAALPPLVSSAEVERLRFELAEAAEGRRFLLQAGDCAERFSECTSPRIAAQLKVLLQMGLVLERAAGVPVIRVGRLGGQYAKPRSEAVERRGAVSLPSFAGDLVNRPTFSPEARTPDPALLVEGYARAALTVNFIRALIDGGFGDLNHPEWWSLDGGGESAVIARWNALVDSVRRGVGANASVGEPASAAATVPVFTSREGLLLAFEAAQTRTVPRRSGWWNLATHFPWIGVRTLRRGSAHVEYFRGLENPIGLKVGPQLDPRELVELLGVLDPRRVPGRITLIHRFGAAEIERCLPEAIAAVAASGHPVLWCLDPMHGNGEWVEVPRGGGEPVRVKTRRIERIVEELEAAGETHRRLGVRLGGLHLEATPEPVTECLGGRSGVGEVDLPRDYRSLIDPRLNYLQALEVAFAAAERLFGASAPSDEPGTPGEPLVEVHAGDRNRTCMGFPTGT